VAWKDGGREVSESRTLAVRAGDVTRASFPAKPGELQARTAKLP
jgi:hypothetical protein